MRIFPRPLQIGETEGFTAEKDIFGRHELGAGLTNLVSSVSDPMVIAIDGQWGSGKTVFLKMWAGHLRLQGFPVIYFDAFENDYVEDAFAVLAAEIIGLVERERKADEPRAKQFLTKAVDAGKVIARSALKIGVKVATAGALASSDIEDLADAMSSEAEDLFDKHVGELITKQAERRTTLQAFRDALEQLPSLLTASRETMGSDGPNASKPLIFMIDELDRCRPGFALEMLERVKHFFQVQNVHFVLGTHMGQLRSSINAAYGADIDSVAYLQKFVNLQFPLTDHARYKSESTTSKYISYISNEISITPNDIDFRDSVVGFTKTYSLLHDSSLRQIEHFFSNIALAAAFTGDRSFRPPPLIAGLSILRVEHPVSYARAKRGTLRYAEAERLLGLNHVSAGNDDYSGYMEWERGWWRYATDPDADQETIDKYARGLFEFGVGDRLGVAPMLCHKIIDKLIDYK